MLFPSSTIASHLAEQQAARGTCCRAPTGISSDAADNGTFGRPGHHVFTRRGPLTRSGYITEQGASDGARRRTFARVAGDATDIEWIVLVFEVGIAIARISLGLELPSSKIVGERAQDPLKTLDDTMAIPGRSCYAVLELLSGYLHKSV